MKIIQSTTAMQATASELKQSGRRIGFVPTMGFLHEGHLSLMRVARERADTLVVSIFVNPTQFGPGEDFEDYPRDLRRDETLCRDVGVDILFYPSADDMYPPDFSTHVMETVLSKQLCGRARPTHFQGVTTVVTKLFNLVQPDFAVFGRKDAQQVLVIQRMVRDLNMPLRITVAPTVREKDGLAVSSRNTYLDATQRQQAGSIYAGLKSAKRLWENGERDTQKLVVEVQSHIEQSGGTVDYVNLVSREQLRELETVSEPALLAVAAFFGTTRLIDNVYLG